MYSESLLLCEQPHVRTNTCSEIGGSFNVNFKWRNQTFSFLYSCSEDFVTLHIFFKIFKLSVAM